MHSDLHVESDLDARKHVNIGHTCQKVAHLKEVSEVRSDLLGRHQIGLRRIQCKDADGGDQTYRVVDRRVQEESLHGSTVTFKGHLFVQS